MGATTTGPVQRRPATRMAGLVIAGVLIVVLLMIGPPWLAALDTQPQVRRATIVLLMAAEAIYVAGVIASGAAAGILGGVVARRRRSRERVRPLTAKFLLLSISILLAALMAEGGAQARRAWDQRALTLTARSADVRLPDLPESTSATGAGKTGAGEEIRIVVLGESSAEGVPYQDRLSIGTIVAWQLQQALPRRRVSVNVLARSGATLEAMHRELSRLTYRPDVLIVYAGHNEFSSRFSWSHGQAYYADASALTTREALERVAGRFSAVCTLIQQWAESRRVGRAPPPWVTRRLIDVPVYTPEEYAARRADFQTRLDAIAAYCERVGTLAVLVVPPGNDAGFEPNRSMLAPGTLRPGREAFAREFLAARACEESDPKRAEAQLRGLIDRQPGFAEAHFRLARLREQAGAYDEAYAHYVLARDRDGLPMRCPSDLQQAYHDVASRHGAALVDGQALFRTLSPRGLLDDALFNDGFHPSLRGHIALAQGVLERLRERPTLGWAPEDPVPTIDPAACADHFRMNPAAWKAVCELTATIWRKIAYARSDPTERLAWALRYDEAVSRIAAGKKVEELGIPGLGLAPLSPATARLGHVTVPAR